MITLEQLREKKKDDTAIDVNDLPAVLLLKRKSIRVFPDNQKVAMYYSEKLKKYVTIPFGIFGFNESILRSIGRVAKGAGRVAKNAASGVADYSKRSVGFVDTEFGHKGVISKRVQFPTDTMVIHDRKKMQQKRFAQQQNALKIKKLRKNLQKSSKEADDFIAKSSNDNRKVTP